MNERQTYGGDGSDHMSYVQQQETLEGPRGSLDQMILGSRLGMRVDPRWLRGIGLLPEEYRASSIRVMNQPRVLRAVRRQLHAGLAALSEVNHDPATGPRGGLVALLDRAGRIGTRTDAVRERNTFVSQFHDLATGTATAEPR